MTRKDFELIASAISDASDHHHKQYGDRFPLCGVAVVNSITDALQTAHPAFDRARFLKACGVEKA